MAILDDFTINNTLQTVRHTSGTTVYSVNALYSAIKDYEDDPANMTHPVIMTAQTPTEYTIVNGWFIDNPSTNYLNGGAITTDGYLNEIQRVVTTNAGTDPIASDIGKTVTPATTGTAGPLLHYDLDINDDGTQINAWYVRSGDGTAYSGLMTISAGTGSQTPSTSVDGEEVWANVYHLGNVTSDPAPQFYIEQLLNGADHRIVEWSSLTNWARGALDVLIRVRVEGALIDSGKLLITVRQPGDYYDTTEVTITGGRNPMPLNSATDPDNATAEYYILYDNEAVAAFAAGETITEDTGKWYAEIVSVIDNGTTGVLGLRGLNEIAGALADNDNFTSSGTGTGTVNGTKGDRVIAYDAETGTFTVGLTATDATGAKGVIRGLQDNGTSGLLCTEVNHDYRADSAFYDLFTDNDIITDTSTGSASVDLVTTNLQDGVSGYDKIDIVFQHGSLGVAGGHTLTAGMHVTQVTSGATGTITKVDGNTIYLGNTSIDFDNTNVINDDDTAGTGTANGTPNWSDSHTLTQAFQQATNKNYDVVIFMNNATVQEGYEYCKFVTGDGSTFSLQMYELVSATLTRAAVEGQFYLSAYRDVDTPANTYDKLGKRTAPLGTFAGGTWFTARGIWLDSVASADAIKFQLIDSDNATQTPPNFVAIITNNNVSGDRVGVYEDDGTGNVKKDTYNSHATNNTIGTTDFDVDGTPSIRLDAPSAGWLIVTDDSSTSGQVREHAYYYTSWSGDNYVLDAITDSTGTAGVGGLTHTNSGRNFTADGVLPGMMCRNVTDGSIGIIATVGTTTFTVKQLEGGAENDFDTGDVVEINKLVVTYVAADTAFNPYISETAGGATTSVTVIYSADRTLLGKVRNKGVIYAVDAASTLTNTGATIPTVRTPDNIAT